MAHWILEIGDISIDLVQTSVILEIQIGIIGSLERAGTCEHHTFLRLLDDSDSSGDVAVPIADPLHRVDEVLRRHSTQGKPAGHVL